MLETMTPVCEACGHFCRKVIQSVPVIVSATQPIEPSEPVQSGHHCGSSCVLHRPTHPQDPEAEKG
jgi:hypothetical protein